jgi:hypothetical protein
MIAKTLKTVLLKTANVTGVKLVTPADRIGLGLRASLAYSTDNLSLGQNPQPQNPELEQPGEQPLSTEQMPMHLHAGDGDAPPAGSAGCPSTPGFTAVTFGSASAVSLTGWRRTIRAAATSRAPKACSFARDGRANFPGDPRRDMRPGSDCQSPGRVSDKRNAKREVNPATAAKK